MFKKKTISKTSIESIVHQIRYLINEKKASDKELVWRLQNILSDYGISVDYIERPKPWELKI